MSLRRDILREAERRGPFSARLLHRVRELARRGGIEDREALADHLAARFAEAGEPRELMTMISLAFVALPRMDAIRIVGEPGGVRLGTVLVSAELLASEIDP